MSDKGSFCTQTIFCHDCLQIVTSIFQNNESDMYGELVDLHGKPSMIIAGQIVGNGGGNEFINFENYIRPLLEQKICHPLKITLIPENLRVQTYRLKPNPKAQVVQSSTFPWKTY